MSNKYVILNELGHIVGLEKSDEAILSESPSKIKVDNNYEIPLFPFKKKRTKHVWRYSYHGDTWVKTEDLRNAIPGEVLVNDDSIESLEDLLSFQT